MQVEIKVPVMGESVTEAIISTILAPSGTLVASGQEILELETDKVNQVLYAPESGVVHLDVAVGQTVKIGDKVGFVDTAGQKSIEPAVPQTQIPRKAPQEGVVVQENVVVRKGVADFLSEPKAMKPPVALPVEKPSSTTRKRMSGLRKTIASRLVEVKNTTAMLTTFNEVDMSTVLEIRNREKESFQTRYGVKLGLMSFFVKATVAALKAYPIIHSRIEGEEIVTPSSYDIGVAVSTDKGLFVPVVRACDTLSFGEVETAIGSFAKKAREGSIAVDDLKGGSFTITNGGVFGSLLSTPILNPPQSAILGMHSIVKRPVAVEDRVEIHPMMYLALSYDHRLIDGKDAVLFLVHLKESLEDPARLLLDL